jgi:hypothetical protein
MNSHVFYANLDSACRRHVPSPSCVGCWTSIRDRSTSSRSRRLGEKQNTYKQGRMQLHVYIDVVKLTVWPTCSWTRALGLLKPFNKYISTLPLPFARNDRYHLKAVSNLFATECVIYGAKPFTWPLVCSCHRTYPVGQMLSRYLWQCAGATRGAIITRHLG